MRALLYFLFFFQAEDGIRYIGVTGVQTCALPIFETTVNLLGNGVVLLDAHREQWDALRAAPSGWDGAVEEILRFDSPVQITGRTAKEQATLAGREVRPGTRVTVLLGAANRDPEVFAGPARFDVGRANAREHLAF